jgi:hypothetical protein
LRRGVDRIEGVWNLDEARHQSQATVKFEGGEEPAIFCPTNPIPAKVRGG